MKTALGILGLVGANAFAQAPTPVDSSIGASSRGDGGSIDVLETCDNSGSGITGHTSSRYTITVEQNGGGAQDNMVLYLENESGFELSPETHWTAFSYQGADPEVVVAVNADITAATVRPSYHAITPKVDTISDTVTFRVPDQGQYYVQIDEMGDYPLLVFADPPETDVPDPLDPNVHYYEASATPYNLDPAYKEGGNPIHYEVEYGDEVYIEPCAWVDGAIEVRASGSGQFRLRGRGVLSGSIYEFQGNQSSELVKGPSGYRSGGAFIEGIQFIDAKSRNIVLWDRDAEFNFLKMISYYHNSGGPRLRPGSIISNSFFKINDDVLKVVDRDATAENIVVWLQTSGSAVLYSWDASSGVHGNMVDGLYIIENDRPNISTPGNHSQTINNSVAAVRNVAGGDIYDNTIQNVVIETQPWQLFGFHGTWDTSRFMDGEGSMEGLVFKNWSVAQEPYTESRFDAVEFTNPGKIENFDFQNIEIDGENLDADDIGTRLLFFGEGADGTTFTFSP